MSTNATIRPAIPFPQFTYFGTETGFAQRIVAEAILSVVFVQLGYLGPNVWKRVLARKNLFWFLMLLVWLVTMVLIMVQWASNYHIMVHLRGSTSAGAAMILNTSICIYFFYFFGYSLLTSLRLYRLWVVITRSAQLRRMALVFLVAHSVWVTFSTLFVTYWVSIDFTGVVLGRTAIPGIKDLVFATPIYFRIVTWLSDGIFLWFLKTSSMKYASDNSLQVSRTNKLLYIVGPFAMNLTWLILHLLADFRRAETSVIASFIATTTLAAEIAGFFYYTNHVMESLFSKEISTIKSSGNKSSGVHSV